MNTDPVPSMTRELLHDLLQKALTMLAAFLVTKGLLPNEDNGRIVELSTGVLFAGVSVAWTYVANRLRQVKFHNLLNLEPPK